MTPERSALSLRPMHLPQVHREVLDSGLCVQVASRRGVPLFCARVLVRAGSELDPKGREGLADLSAQLYRRGTRRHSAHAIDEAIEFVGGQLAIGAGVDQLGFRVSAPSEHFDELLAILAELIREPRFDPREVESTRARMLAELQSDRDDPALIADKAIQRHLWGAHPYAHDGGGSLSSVARLSRADVAAFHAERVGPRVALLTIVGDVKPSHALAAARRAFSRWSGGPREAPVLAAPTAAPGAGKVLLIDGPELTQSHVRLAWRSLRRAHPDSTAASLVNNALGGGFTSRLTREIRVRRGLTYGISSHFDWRALASAHEVSTSTRTARTREMIDVAWREVRRMKERGPGKNELTDAQRYVVGLYPASVERNESISSRLGDVWLYNLPDDWIARYRDRVAAISLAHARRAAREHLAPHPPAIVVVGNGDKVAKRLSALGPLEVESLAEWE